MKLSTAQDLKSTNFDNVKTIIFDEFIIEEGQKKFYLKNEVFTFLNLVETIARLRDVRIFLLANSANKNNPYFLYFDLSLPFNNDIKLFKDGLILVQYMRNEEYRQLKKETRLGRLVEGTSYSDYAIDNKFCNENNSFIEKKQGSAKFSFAFIYDNQTFGVWSDYKLGKIYVSSDYVTSPYLFSTSVHNHNDKTIFLKSFKRYSCWKTFVEQYELGNVRFENSKVKGLTEPFIMNLLATK